MGKLICPFCGKKVDILVCDDEGNVHDKGYEENPYSGLGYILSHVMKYGMQCPIAHYKDEQLGINIYESREEAAQCFNKRM